MRVENVDPPVLGPGQARVRVRAAAVNFPDVLLVAGTYQVAVPPPFVPGSELAGEVVEVASDVTGLSVGLHVFGSTLVGAFAQEATVVATSLTPVPAGVTDRVAAAFGVAHRTAYHVLRSVAALRPGEELVVLGAGGGVGLAAVQLGVLLGATVTAVASSPGEAACGASPSAPPGSSIIATATCVGHSVRHCPTGSTSSSTPWAARWPSRRCGRCATAAGS